MHLHTDRCRLTLRPDRADPGALEAERSHARRDSTSRGGGPVVEGGGREGTHTLTLSSHLILTTLKRFLVRPARDADASPSVCPWEHGRLLEH